MAATSSQARGRAQRATGTVVAGVLTLVLAGCGGPVEVDGPALTGADAAACRAFADGLPPSLAEQARVEISPADAPAAAYGDPAIVVRCGVGRPKGFGPGASCEVVDGVGFYLPAEQYDDQDLDLTLTTAGYRPRIEISVPAQYRPNGGAAAMAALAPLVTENLRLVEPCE